MRYALLTVFDSFLLPLRSCEFIFHNYSPPRIRAFFYSYAELTVLTQRQSERIVSFIGLRDTLQLILCTLIVGRHHNTYFYLLITKTIFVLLLLNNKLRGAVHAVNGNEQTQIPSSPFANCANKDDFIYCIR